MPDYLPAHRELVYASGLAEIAGGAGVLFSKTARPAGWWLELVYASGVAEMVGGAGVLKQTARRLC